MLLASQFVKRLLWKYILRGSLVAPILLATSLLAPSAQAVDLKMNGTRTVLSGIDCDIATYRFGTSNVFNGKNLDLLVEVLSEDNDNTAGLCIKTLPVTGNNILTVDIRDRDATDTDAFMDLKFTVVESGTLTPVEVDRIAISGFDLDSNIDARNPRQPVYDSGTDDIYVQAPDGVYISSGSLVTYTEGTFIGGAFPTYQTKFKGRTTGDCSDGAGTSVDVTCRAGAIRINGVSGVNKVSTFTLRVQNDDAYGRVPNTDTTSLRRFQLSFEISELEELITANTDYGDALASYGDARHSVSGNIALGYGLPPDHEAATTAPSASANGDDNDGADSVKFDDEEGVSRGGTALNGQSLLTGSTTNLDITTFGTGRLSGWLDLNRDGDFNDAGEQVITDLSITSTSVLTTAVPISIPGTATAGTSMMRFRFSTAIGVTASGLSTTDGEVEDYQVAIAAATYSLSGNIFDDLDGSKIKAASGEDYTTANITAVLLDVSNNVISTAAVNATGDYTLSSVSAGTYSIKIIQTPATALMTGAVIPPANDILPTNWVATGENNNGTPDATVDRIQTVTVAAANIANINFGIEQLPDTTALTPPSQSNPGGTATVPVTNLAGTDPEDGALGTGKTFKIVTLPTNADLYYNGTKITTPNFVIANYDPTKLLVDPNDGAITVSFTYAAVDAAGQQDSTPATVAMPFTTSSSPANLLLVKRITAINGTPLNVFKDDTDNTMLHAADDNNVNWPTPLNTNSALGDTTISTFLRGAIDGGKVKPGDTVEYTIYFLNAGGGNANNVRVCDRITGEQKLLSGSTIQLQQNNAIPTALTSIAGDDRATFYASSSDPAISNCNFTGTPTLDNGAIVVDVTGATGSPTWTTLPGSTGPGTINTYGLVRFTTKVNP